MGYPSAARQKFVISVLVLMTALAWIVPQALNGDECYEYPNSRVAFIWGVATCAYSGSYCADCSVGGVSCVGDIDGEMECVMHDLP